MTAWKDSWVFLAHVNAQIESFDAYHGRVTATLNQELEAFAEKIDALPKDKQDEYVELNYDELANLRDEFPQVLRSTALVSLYSLIEHNLFSVCRSLKYADKLTFSVEDFNGKGIEQAKRYIKKGVGCHRSIQNQPLGVGSKPTTLRVTSSVYHGFLSLHKPCV